MSQSSLMPELPVAPGSDRSRPSALFSTLMLLGVGSALMLAAPGLLRSLRVLLSARVPGSSLPPLFEVTLGLLGVLALGSAVVGVVLDLRTRVRGLRWRRRRQRQPWEEYLMETDALVGAPPVGVPPLRLHQGNSARPAPVDAGGSVREQNHAHDARPAQPLRSVEATPWPLGSGHAPRNQGRVATVTRLGLPVTPLPEGKALPSSPPASLRAARSPAWHEPAVATPFPFSVWNYHDNSPEGSADDALGKTLTRGWLWTVLIAAAIGVAGALLMRNLGISIHF